MRICIIEEVKKILTKVTETFKLVPLRTQHNTLIESFEKKQKANIFGGSKFPMDGAYIFFECENKDIVEDFVKHVPFILLSH